MEDTYRLPLSISVLVTTHYGPFEIYQMLQPKAFKLCVLTSLDVTRLSAVYRKPRWYPLPFLCTYKLPPQAHRQSPAEETNTFNTFSYFYFSLRSDYYYLPSRTLQQLPQTFSSKDSIDLILKKSIYSHLSFKNVFARFLSYIHVLHTHLQILSL